MQTIKRALKKLIASNRYSKESILQKIEETKNLLTDSEYKELKREVNADAGTED